MADFPRSLIEFHRRFPDEEACAAWLATARWPDGFRCPGCRHDKGWELAGKPFTWECAGCGRQTSVTAGTVMHGSKLALTVWFWAAYLMATHSNGISALQLLRQLGLGSYKTAWLLCAKLRRAMIAPDRNPLAGIVEIDETTIPYRTGEDLVASGGGRSGNGKMLIAGAVEVADNRPGRVRASPPSRISPPQACTPSSRPTSPQGQPPRPMAGPPTKARPASPTTRTSSARWPPTSCCPGRIACSRTSSAGPWASITACAASISNPTSTSSCSASIDATPRKPPSAPS